MNKILFFLIVLLFPFVCLAQSFPNNSLKQGNGELKSVGLFMNGGITNIYRNTDVLPALGEGNFEAGLSFGKKFAFVVKGGMFTQSDFFVSQNQSNSFGSGYQNSWGGYNTYDCGCGTNQTNNQSSSDRFLYLKIGYFQAGFSQQGDRHGLRLTGGLGAFSYQVPSVDSLGNETSQLIARGTVFAIGFDFKSRIGKDLFSARLQSYTDTENPTISGTIAKAEIDYLLGLEGFNNKLYIGIGGAAKNHIVSGDEYSFRVIAEMGHNEIPIWMRFYVGAAYNQLPEEGLGFEFGFQMSVDRFAKSLYR